MTERKRSIVMLRVFLDINNYQSYSQMGGNKKEYGYTLLLLCLELE